MNSCYNSFIENKIKSIPFKKKSGIKLWYCEISSILELLFNIEKHPKLVENYNIIRNQTIDKQDFLIPYLSDLELKTLNNFKSLKKQIEWLSGRFLLKSCLSLFLKDIDKLENIKVVYEKEGAPFLPGFPNIKISLSHSGNYAAVGICTDNNLDIGIDLEEFRKKPDKSFIKTAFTQNEIKSMDNTIEDILTKWTVKEAFLKYIKKGFNESLHRVEVIGKRVLYNQKEVQVSVFSEIINKSYVLSSVIGHPINPPD